MRTKFAAMDGDDAVSAYHDERDDNAQCLCKRCGQGSSRCIIVKDADEEYVEHDVGDTGDGDEVHRTLRVTQASEDACDDVVGYDERDADETDIEVVLGAFDGFCWRFDEADDTLGSSNQNHGEEEREHHKERDGVADHRSRFPVVACTDGLPDYYRRSHRKTNDDDGEHVHYLRADADRRDAGYATVLADDKEVNHTIEYLHEIGEQIGQREGDDVA